MKTKNYRNGKYWFSSYMKQVGEGFEVGFFHGKDPIFVGNFIHQKEATQWYTIMNRQIRLFSKKYTVAEKFPMSWYMHFAKSHLYKCYYTFLDRLFTRHQKTFDHSFKKDLRRYNKMKKSWDSKMPFFKAA